MRISRWGVLLLLGALLVVSGTAWAESGDKLFVGDFDDNQVVAFDVENPFNLSNTSEVETGALDRRPRGITFNDTGLKMFASDNQNDEIREFNLSAPWSLSTIENGRTLDLTGEGGNTPVIESHDWKPDGTKLYVFDEGNEVVIQHNFSTGYDLGSKVGQVEEDINCGDCGGIEIKPDGTRLFVTDQGAAVALREYEFGERFNAATLVRENVDSKSLPGVPEDVVFKPDGSKFFISDGNNDVVREFVLSEPWNISTATEERTLDLTGTSAAFAVGLEFKIEGPAPPPSGPAPTDFFEGLEKAIEGFGFRSPESKFFFSLALIGLTMVATGAGVRWMRSGQAKNWVIAGSGMLVGVFTVLLGFVSLWEFVVAVVLGGVGISAGPESVKNTFAELKEDVRALASIEEEPTPSVGVDAEGLPEKLEFDPERGLEPEPGAGEAVEVDAPELVDVPEAEVEEVDAPQVNEQELQREADQDDGDDVGDDAL